MLNYAANGHRAPRKLSRVEHDFLITTGDENGDHALHGQGGMRAGVIGAAFCSASPIESLLSDFLKVPPNVAAQPLRKHAEQSLSNWKSSSLTEGGPQWR